MQQRETEGEPLEGEWWKLQTYHKNENQVTFEGIRVFCRMQAKWIQTEALTSQKLKGPSHRVTQQRVLHWLSKEYNITATVRYQIHGCWPKHQEFGPVPIRELLKSDLELEDVRLPSAWYPPAIVEYNYVTNIWIDNSSVKLIIAASKWRRNTDTKIETHRVGIKLARHQDGIQHQQEVIQWLIRSYSSVTSSYYKTKRLHSNIYYLWPEREEIHVD
jgi:hypothetical protein